MLDKSTDDWYDTAMNEKTLGRRIQAARSKAGFTQQTLCQKAGLSYSTLTKIERGAIKSPSVFTVQDIAKALGIGLDELLGHKVVQRKNRSKSGVTFVYFDINGCLVRFFHGAFTRIADDTHAPEDVVETAFWRFNERVCRGEITMDEFNKEYAKALGVPKIDWLQYYLEAAEPIAAMQPLLEWVSQHYRVGLLSNIMPGVIETMQAKKMIPNVPYDAIVDSSKVKLLKPEVKMYETAAKKAGVPDHEILFVDDSRTNLMAAQKQGWHVLWFDEYRPERSIARVKAALELTA